MPHALRNLAAAAAAGVTAVTLAACGGSSPSSTAQGGATAGTPASTASSAATVQPVTVGFLNEQLGAIAFPDFGAGAQAARVYINDHGGIGRRPLQFLNCYTDGSPTSSIACANRFVAAHVSAVLEGIDVGSDAAVPILASAGIPLVGHTAFGNVQSNSPDAFFFGAATGAYDVVPLQVMARNLGLHSVTYLAEDNPQDRGFVTADSVPAARSLGLKYKPIFYNAATPNYQSSIASAMATGAQALFFTAPEPDCTSLVSAARTLGYKGAIVAGSCSAFIASDGVTSNGVFTASDLYVPDDSSGVPTAAAAQVSTYISAMNSYAPKYTQGFAQDTFSSTMDLATVLRGMTGNISGQAVLAALRGINGQQSFMGQALDCNGRQWPGERAACASGLIEYQVRAGKRVMYTHGFVNAQALVNG